MGMISPILDDYMPTAQCTTRTGGRLTDRSRASEVPATAAAPPPALPEIVEPQFRQAPISAMDTSGQCPQDSTSAGSPRLYPPLPVSTDGKREENIAIRQRLCSTKEHGERTLLQMPLRELRQPPVQDAWGTTISPL